MSKRPTLKAKKYSAFAEIWRRLRKNKLAMIGLIVICVIVLFAVFADLICNYDMMVIAQNAKERFLPPSAQHWFGTDDLGRDIFARVIHGARVSLAVGIVTTLFAVLGACILGSVVAYYGGIVDSILMRFLDIMNGIPILLLAIAISASLGPGIGNLMLAITIAQIPGFTRIIRSVILNIVDMEYIEAARAYGARDWYIIARHILPNAIGPIIVQATMSVATMILNTAALSYLGLGMQPPAPELGAMLSDAKEYMRYSPYGVLFPGLTIAVMALSLNLFGDGLRDALDPRLRN